MKDPRFLVNIETYICGSAWFLMNQRMEELSQFIPRSTNKEGSIALRPKWERHRTLWLLLNSRQVYGAANAADANRAKAHKRMAALVRGRIKWADVERALTSQ